MTDREREQKEEEASETAPGNGKSKSADDRPYGIPVEERDRGLRPTIKRMGRVYGSILGISWDVTKARSAALISTLILLALWGSGSALLIKIVVDKVTIGAPGTYIFGGIFIAAVAIATLLQDFMGILAFDLADRITHEVERRIMRVAAGAPGLEHMERPEYADKLKVVRDHTYVPLNAIFNANSFAYVVFGIATGVFLLGSIHPLLALMPAAGIPGALLQFWSHRKHLDRFDETAPEERLANHYLQITTGVEAAKEVRLFALGNEVVRRFNDLSQSYIRKLFRDRLKKSTASIIGGLIYGGTMAGSIAFIGWLASEGRATAGDVAMGVQIVRQTIGQVQMATSVMAWLAELSFVGERYLWMLDYESPVRVNERESLVPAPRTIRHGVTFEDVKFVYPGTEKVVLEDISFFIPARSTVALVGENGAGKTSVVKLLCRFYDPTEGRITVDGTDLRDIDLEGWRARSAVAFQDFVKFQLIAREAVSAGDLNAIDNLERVGAATRFAGADRVVEKLPQGLDTQLGREFEGGIELSEGEWQRVALARGAMPPSPVLVVLDEPTASLDARAENDVFERFAELASGGDGFKPITVLVSHRFSTVRMADLIIVVHEGGLAELGSHEELMESGGRYATLFKLQASRYD